MFVYKEVIRNDAIHTYVNWQVPFFLSEFRIWIQSDPGILVGTGSGLSREVGIESHFFERIDPYPDLDLV